MTIDNNIISLTGLFFDFIGVALIFRFGISPTLYDQNSDMLTIGTTDIEKKKSKTYKQLSNLGFFFIVIGFIFQAIGN